MATKGIWQTTDWFIEIADQTIDWLTGQIANKLTNNSNLRSETEPVHMFIINKKNDPPQILNTIYIIDNLKRSKDKARISKLHCLTPHTWFLDAF